MRRGQALIDYIILVGLVAAAFIALLIYIGRSQHGNIRSQAEQLEARQYEPSDTTVNNSESKYVKLDETSASGTSTTHGSTQDKNTAQAQASKAAQDAITANTGVMYQDYMWLEYYIVGEAQAQAGLVLAGTCPWDPITASDGTTNNVAWVLGKMDKDGAKFDALGKTAEAAAKALKDSLTPDKSSSGSMGTQDSRTDIIRHINERLGPLR